MSRWFRHYAGMMRDDKLVRVALQSQQPVERVLWVWGAILETAAEINDDGRYDFDPSEAAYFLRADEADIARILECLTQLGRISEGRVAKWSDRQFKSDTSTDRVRNHRDRHAQDRDRHRNGSTRKRNGAVTKVKRFGNPPETEAETDTKTESTVSARSPDPNPDNLTIPEFLDRRKPKPPDPEPWLKLASGIVGAFDEANNPNVPDTRRAEMWLAQGYEPDLCLAVVREGLSRKRERTISTLAYFDDAIREAHEKRVPASAKAEPIDWRHWAKFYREHGSWPAWLGPEPGFSGCKCPPEFLTDDQGPDVAPKKIVAG